MTTTVNSNSDVTPRHRRRGLANILQGLTEHDLINLHSAYRAHTPPTDDVTNDDVEWPEQRHRVRRNAVCYNTDTEQVIRNIIRDVHIATYLNGARQRNGYV